LAPPRPSHYPPNSSLSGELTALGNARIAAQRAAGAAGRAAAEHRAALRNKQQQKGAAPPESAGGAGTGSNSDGGLLTESQVEAHGLEVEREGAPNGQAAAGDEKADGMSVRGDGGGGGAAAGVEVDSDQAAGGNVLAVKPEDVDAVKEVNVADSEGVDGCVDAHGAVSNEAATKATGASGRATRNKKLRHAKYEGFSWIR
jgi:hypothetical protein